ncbi:MAG: GNAT family protein [bacterium]
MTDSNSLELVVDKELVLRQFSLQDTDQIFSLIDRNREHLSHFGDTTAEKYPNLETVYASIDSPPNPSRLRLGIWASGTLVGSINLTPNNHVHSAEIGYYLGQEFQGKRYMTRTIKRLVRYGFEDLGLHEIWARVSVGNLASAAVLLGSGFTRVEEKSTAADWYYSKTR